MARNALKDWNKKTFGSLKERKDKLEKELMEIQRKLDNVPDIIEQCRKERGIRNKLEELAEQK